MKIAVDAMGGDYAPEETVKGALLAQEEGIAEIILVGNPDLPKAFPEISQKNIEFVPSTEVIGMDEHPAKAVRSKKDASIVVATRLVADKKADGLISAGSTGAQMAAALLILGRIKGVMRPAISTLIPTLNASPLVLLDAGANTDCGPRNLLEFALMGEVYAKVMLDIQSPTIGLLNIGQEETKGNELALAAHSLLKDNLINFKGNVEPRDFPNGPVDVVVCDGFVGNALLKFGEGLVGAVFKLLEKEIKKSTVAKTAAFLMIPTFKNLIKKLDYSEYGGAPLLGVDGVSMVCHGSSDAKAIKSAVSAAVRAVESDFVEVLKSQFL